LRSSPTPEGRCCCRDHPGNAPQHRVAILTDPGGSVLPSRELVGHLGAELDAASSCDPHRPRRVGAARPTSRRCSAATRRCDPHRPRRVGAASANATAMAVSAELRSSPTPEGRCCPCPTRTRSSGSWRCDPHRPRRVGAALAAKRDELEIETYSCDPHRPRRVGAARYCKPRNATTRPRCDPHRPRRVGAARVVATDWKSHWAVAILTDPGGSVLHTPARCRAPGSSSSCDPHRPRRVGAAVTRPLTPAERTTWLRSSPTPEGRCCGLIARAVIIHDKPLRSSPTPEGRCCLPPSFARCLRAAGCDPHRPRRVGAA